MGKVLRTNADYTIKTGSGASGSNQVILDSNVVRVMGDLITEGTTTTVNTATLDIEDPLILLSKNNSGTDVDSGIMINRDGIGNNAAFYWNEGADTFKAVLTTSPHTATSVADTALARIQAAEPASASDVATRNYVDTSASSFTLKVAGDDSTAITVASGQLLQFVGTNGITTAGSEPDTITISLGRNLDNIDTISTDRSNQDLTLKSNGTGAVVIDDVLSFSGMATDPTATAQTKVYNKTAGGGGTGLYFRNSNIGSGAVGELISKSKATALAIALG